MCGIVGIIGHEPVAGHLVEALKRLEYRGYDSAGVATLDHGALGRRRAEGKLAMLEKKLGSEPLPGNIGIGHTRWATHGKPSESNAHPHATAKVAVAHNGIIENFRELRERLVAAGAKFSSETDTEVVAHLVTEEMNKGKTPVDAVAATLKQLRGAFALAFLFAGEDNLMIGARRGSPLAIGYGKDEMYLGSDAIALAPFTNTISYLEDGDWAVLTRKSAEIRDEKDKKVERPIIKSSASADPTAASPIPLPAPVMTATTSTLQLYIVQQGDTLFSLARRYGVTVEDIQRANNLTSDNIYAGQQLIIPTP